MLSSTVSAIPVVRSNLLDMQRNLALNTNKDGAIIDGRDIGTVVFPKANLKIFLTASNVTKAKRRFNELSQKGLNIKYEDVLNDIISRDEKDSSRNIAPLVKAENAISVDTDALTIDEVIDIISVHIDKLI